MTRPLQLHARGLTLRAAVRAIPDLLTFSRLGFAALFPMVAERAWSALLVLFLAGLSDVVDGWAARRLDVAGGIGGALDPVVDKIFFVSVAVTLLVDGLLGPVMLLLLCTRELLELPLLAWAAASSRVRHAHPQISATGVGKLATTLQFATVALALFRLPHLLPAVLTAVAGVAAGVSYWRTLLRLTAGAKPRP